MKGKKILVTGGAGYIGSVLLEHLLEEGHEVKCLDRFFFGRESVERLNKNANLELIQDDIRWFHPKLLDDIDVILDLAALSNDPSGELDPSKTMDINYLGRSRVARLGKNHGVKRYILASSCSIYGFRDGILDENSPINPITTYSKANRKAEISTTKLADDNFTTTMLRFATVYGLSPRMRFDLAVNGMVLGFFKNKEIPIMRNGLQWRPFIHIRDVAEAYIHVLKSPEEKVNSQIFNVGSTAQNYQIIKLAKEIAISINIQFRKRWYGDPDTRSYRVSFDKIKNILGYSTRFTVKQASKEIYDALKKGIVTDSIKTKTVEWYRYLLESKKTIDNVILNDAIL